VVRFRQKLKKPGNSNLHGFELYRPSNKGTKLRLQVIKAITKKHTCICTGAQVTCLVHATLSTKKCTYTHTSTPVWRYSNFLVMETIAKTVLPWKPDSWGRQEPPILHIGHGPSLGVIVCEIWNISTSWLNNQNSPGPKIIQSETSDHKIWKLQLFDNTTSRSFFPPTQLKLKRETPYLMSLNK